jgi:transcriptional regulator with XRE-family HTH domain
MNHELIRSLRKSEGLTLVEMAEKTGYTPSFLSQVERGLKQTSLEAMRKIANCLNIPVISLLDEKIEVSKPTTTTSQYSIIRKQDRNSFVLDEECATYELLTPQDADGPRKYSMFGVIATVAPGKWANEKSISHFYEESCYVVKGKMRALIGDEVFEVKTGDSFYITSFAFHNYQNIGDEDLIIINYQAK